MNETGTPRPRLWRPSIGRLASAALLVSLCAGWLPGVSVLDFPRLAFEPGTITGVAIVNPNPEDADVTLTAYGQDGAVLAVRQMQIPAGRQIATLTRQLFGSDFGADTVGWFRASSASSGLTGFFLILNGEGTQFDGADIPVRARRIIFHQVRVGGGFSTELNLVNTSDVAVEVELTLVVEDEEPLADTLQVAALGAARLDLGTFFGQEEVPAGAYVLAESRQDLVGFELIRTPGGDIQGLNARSSNEILNAIYFPQVSVLGPFVTRLGLANLSDRALIATVTAHGPDGRLFVDEVRANPVAISLAPGQSVDRELVELFGFRGEEPLEGWLEVRSTSAGITGYLELQAETGAAATLSPMARGRNRALFSHLATSLGFFTGVALLNSGTLAADVRMVALNTGGELLGTFDAVLLPGQRISRMVTDLIPEADGQAGGLLLIRSNVPIFASSLFGTDQGSVLSNIPAQPAPESFRPDAEVPVPRVVPRFAILFEGRSQEFRAEQLSGSLRWLVNGIEGGSAEFGTVDSAGRYTAPPLAPDVLPAVVTAVSGPRSVAASVDVASARELASGVGLVQSLAFLSSLQRLYTAELGAVGGFAGTSRADARPVQGLLSTIFGMGEDGERTFLIDLEGEEVPKMISFLGRDGQEYLLVAGQTSGQVLRVDPRTGDSIVVSRDLNAPQALVLDPVTGNLLVAEAEQVTAIPRRLLESDLTPAAAAILPEPGAPLPKTIVLAPIADVAGLTVDACTGRVYLSLRTGSLVDYERDSGESNQILDGLGRPGQVVGIYRAGVSCPDSFQLLIVEEEADQVTLVAPSQGEVVSPWVADIDLDDIALLPEDSPFEGRIAFDTSTGVAENNLLGITLPGVYEDEPINPPRVEVVPATTSPPGPDLAAGQSQAAPGESAIVRVFYRPGPSEERPGANGLALTLNYDSSRLLFDPSDTNGDGLPDSISPNTPAGFQVFVFFDADAPQGELGIGIVDPSGLGVLPEDDLMTIAFRVVEGAQGTADVGFSSTLPPQGLDLLGTPFGMNEVADGFVAIVP